MVFHDVFGSLSDVSLDDVVTVEERHLSVGLDPDLEATENEKSLVKEQKTGKWKERVSSSPCAWRTSPTSPTR